MIQRSACLAAFLALALAAPAAAETSLADIPLPPAPPPRPAEAAPLPGRTDCAGLPRLHFTTPVRPETEIVVAAVGDVLLHGRLQRQAFAHADGFHSLWGEARALLAAADVAYANLEGPIAEGVAKTGAQVAGPVDHYDDWVYSSYPMFNYHPTLAEALAEAGIDVVSTANNHSLDRFALGADRTLEALAEAGVAHTGTRPSDRPDRPWHAVTDAGDYRIAWLACTYGTNGIPDRAGQVLLCYDQQDMVLAEIARLAGHPAVDAVILTPHWGGEYRLQPDAQQQALARAAIDAGALAVIGSHPHVVQPWQRLTAADGREGFVLYSLGNFVSGQHELVRRTTLVLLLGLAEDEAGRLAIAGVRYLPLRFTPYGGTDGRTLTLEATERVDARDAEMLLARALDAGNRHPLHAALTTRDACSAPPLLIEAEGPDFGPATTSGEVTGQPAVN
jgi:poly-gamma-glutamate synthesis protein (capsule biosynthesis protein)